MAARRPRLAGVVFDLDGTLVDSRLDFDRMREELGIPRGQPVLESVESIPAGPRRDVLLRHEMEGARIATLMPGVSEVLARLRESSLPAAILTRNLREPTRITLERLGIAREFSQVVTRECAPAKPNPEGLLRICAGWGTLPGEVLFIGDYRYDLLTGKNAGTMTALFLGKGGKSGAALPEYAGDADHLIESFTEFANRGLENFDVISKR
jgi:HAD superfamily hydrolase (TIGR01509 family)